MFVEFVVPDPTFTVTLCPLPVNVISSAPVVYQLWEVALFVVEKV
jgi:hypothetical protein